MWWEQMRVLRVSVEKRMAAKVWLVEGVTAAKTD